MDNDDLLDFAGYLGLKGQDQDLFYESYYGIEYEEDYPDGEVPLSFPRDRGAWMGGEVQPLH